ncbi:unnamed protein product [Musa acuminata var. zebrina]
MCTPSILDALAINTLKVLFDLALYPLNCIVLVELGTVSPLFALVVKDGQRKAVEDATTVVTQVARCNENVEPFWRADSFNILVDLVNDGDKAMRDVKKVDGVEAIMKALVGNDNKEELEAPR